MSDFYRIRSASLAMVVLVLLTILLLQSEISYNTAYGALAGAIPALDRSELPAGGLVLRVLVGVLLIALWLLKAKGTLFKVIIIVNVLLTFGLFLNLVSLIAVLFNLTPKIVRELLVDVVLMAVSNILIFSIWYWIIDPPGVEEIPRADEAWDFLFPQRANVMPHYEDWLPHYSDYLFLAFSTSFAFSATDTLPLTRRAKFAMMLQSTVSLVTLTGVAGSAINMLAGAS